MPRPASVLVADDDRDVLEALRILLKGEGFDVETVTSPGAILASVKAATMSRLMDMNYTRDTTSAAKARPIAHLATLDPTLPVVVMTAWGSVEGAVEAMRRGARDYIEKPWDNSRLLQCCRTQVELGRAYAKRASRRRKTAAAARTALPELIAESPAMKPTAHELMERVGPSDANVLVTGEHGTGKEVVARWLHARRPRQRSRSIAVNVGGSPTACSRASCSAT